LLSVGERRLRLQNGRSVSPKARRVFAKLNAATIDNFEKLFKRVNETLGA
jgi:hypothetical protein